MAFQYQQTYPQQFPQQYPQMLYPQTYQQMMQQQTNAIPQNQQGQQQIQNGGFLSVASVDEAYHWPIAPGNSLTFKIENSPYICTKTKGFSQLEQPVFEKYRLVKEDDMDTPQGQNEPHEKADKQLAIDLSSYALKTDFDDLKAEFERLKASYEEFSHKKVTKIPKKEIEVEK